MGCAQASGIVHPSTSDLNRESPLQLNAGVRPLHMLTRTPKTLSPQILALAHRLVSGGAPVFVPVRPRANAEINECFGNVAAQVREAGGEIQHGWALWEWPGVMLEAEFHAVWRTPEGGLVDVTARADSQTDILFVADPARVFEGRQVNNVRFALSPDPRIAEYIRVHDEIYNVLNRGERAGQYGAISVPRDEIEPLYLRAHRLQSELSQLRPGRNDPCHCGSGRKFKKCCGAAA